jgi:hypothetical protein
MNVCIKVIPHSEQKYPTCGDWRYDADGTLQIRISKLGNWRYEMLVAVHELVEVLICKHRGISVKAVDRFDIAYEKNRKPSDESEPGDEPSAPYVNEHCAATGVERILAMLLGVKWKRYEEAINRLP